MSNAETNRKFLEVEHLPEDEIRDGLIKYTLKDVNSIIAAVRAAENELGYSLFTSDPNYHELPSTKEEDQKVGTDIHIPEEDCATVAVGSIRQKLVEVVHLSQD